MKLGGFGRIADYPKIKAAGYDYAELDMPEIEALSPADYDQLLEQVEREGFPVLTGARILPITDPLFFVDGFQPNSLKDYLDKTCRRAGQLGIQKIILGNGKARALAAPEDRKKEPVFVDFLRMLSDIAGENGQKLILEPLGPKYSNYINTIPQAVELIGKVNRPNLFAMADLRHMVWSKEPLSDIDTYRPYVAHVHVDYPLSYPERRYPAPGDDYDYGPFLDVLRKMDRQATLTIEADIPSDWAAAHDGAVKVLDPVLE